MNAERQQALLNSIHAWAGELVEEDGGSGRS
jgi:hypothetical protein